MFNVVLFYIMQHKVAPCQSNAAVSPHAVDGRAWRLLSRHAHLRCFDAVDDVQRFSSSRRTNGLRFTRAAKRSGGRCKRVLGGTALL